MDKTAARGLLALDLMEAGIDMKRLQLRRAHPEETDAQIGARLRAWLLDRPMDAPGRVMTWEEWRARRGVSPR